MSDDFHALYVRYAPDVFRFALYLSGNRHDAEDITAETFVRVWTSAEPIRMATVKGYLLTVARNLFLEGLRRRRPGRQVAVSEDLPDPGPGPTARAELDSELAAAMVRLQRLPEVDRAALVLRAVEELPYEEIARALGISLAAVKVKIHRARLAVAAAHEA